MRQLIAEPGYCRAEAERAASESGGAGRGGGSATAKAAPRTRPLWLVYESTMFMYEVYMNWTIAGARARLSEVLRAAEEEPQYLSSRGRRVAVVVAPEEYEAFVTWRRTRPADSLVDALQEIQRVCAEEGYELEVSPRKNRPNAFTAGR